MDELIKNWENVELIKEWRTIYWRLYLNLLPRSVDEWAEFLTKERSTYDELKAKFDFDPSKLSENLEVNNPLSLDDEVWSPILNHRIESLAAIVYG